uniref:Calpain catalytic domain-containing protein n=1 Tax=Ditylenchus dipsaci TaxID=166011 RepID=A0A915DMK4_9BILA
MPKKGTYSLASTASTSQNYRRLKRECQRKKQLFVDMAFPPTNSSLFLDVNRSSDIVWKRPGELVENPQLFVEGASPNDVTQGILGNCWFVSACSALTHNEELLQKVIPCANAQEWGNNNSYCGIFQFQFWRFGEWFEVIVDDLLPTKDGKLLFARSKTPNEFWSALLEKAFAKLYGCYENLVGGQLADALQDVSGGVAETINVRKFLSSDGAEGTGLRLFQTLRNAFDQQALIVAAIANVPYIQYDFLFQNPAFRHQNPASKILHLANLTRPPTSAKSKEDIEKSLDCGLVKGHAYAVTAVRYIDLDAKERRASAHIFPTHERQMMIRLQNPWGEKEWNGPWSDNSAEWEQVKEAAMTIIETPSTPPSNDQEQTSAAGKLMIIDIQMEENDLLGVTVDETW